MRPCQGSQKSHLFPSRILKWIHSIRDQKTVISIDLCYRLDRFTLSCKLRHTTTTVKDELKKYNVHEPDEVNIDTVCQFSMGKKKEV